MQEQPLILTDNTGEDEISLKALINKGNAGLKHLRSKWPIILLFGLFGALLGGAYAHFKKPVYTATSTFVLEEPGKGGGLAQLSGLASLAGIDVGGGGGGIFQGDNILELYKSRVMIEKTLLSPVELNGKMQLLIDRYIASNKLEERWKEKDGITNFSFNQDPAKFSRWQDSIISDIVMNFNKKVLVVDKIDKKLSILKVDIITNDELFAKAFNSKLVETVNDFYTQTKTKKSVQNVNVLQHQADSVKRVLGYSISGVASALDAAPNANPALLSLRVPSQKKQVDVQASGAIYSEIVKNLEVAKISLRQETPLIQVIDQPVLPLPKTELGTVKAIVIGFVLGAILIIIWLSSKKISQKIMS
ncbi:Wzz/FepE/Etk N-terminal domain-containing protein [Mucilaginibacter gilvus]|uniref:Lipopolysaccharide biosynthesis protein n=1 Tax=Mucilaginibacter gilvus TaxID=2305909 RepID=A0A444MLS1_9SPHI|nr:Wzz/FepE/Etk N-terminal domain-containing protein [Mucilaginibacter gilvus]RWY50186.1 lipopolysaccharide biosynthesis protein [Mucilaginibacter gilvus]